MSKYGDRRVDGVLLPSVQLLGAICSAFRLSSVVSIGVVGCMMEVCSSSL